MQGDHGEFQLGEWRVQPQLNRLRNGDQVRLLQKKAMDLLVYLIRKRGTVSTEKILDDVWPDRIVLPAAVHQRIALIRKALGDNARTPRYIETIPGRGYRIIARVTANGAADSVPRRVAILPFADLSPDADLGWLAAGLREHLEQQVAVWSRFEVIPGALTAKASETEPPERTDLLITGFLERHRQSVILNARVVDLQTNSTLWSEAFAGDSEDPYELLQQLVATTARYFGESLGGFPAPKKPAAYTSFLRLLNYRFWGDADEHLFWLERTIDADPDWRWGVADLAQAYARNAAVLRRSELYAQAWQMLETGSFRGRADACACLARTFSVDLLARRSRCGGVRSTALAAPLGYAVRHAAAGLRPPAGIGAIRPPCTRQRTTRCLPVRAALRQPGRPG